MNDLTIMPVPLPVAARVSITTRLATMEDIPFMDGLMKQYNKQLGFFPRAQLEGYVNGQWVLIAQNPATGERLGFCASRDRYLKRDELGVIYLLCVVPGVQRKLIGASLIKAVFDRSAYGCRLYCCWCAQDIAANYFWESLGFVPIAFRAGSTGKKRVHVFWQRRINADDAATPYWYPFQTNSGAIRQDRLVFPIPPGVHWKDVQAVAMPKSKGEGGSACPVFVREAQTRRELVEGPMLSAVEGTNDEVVKLPTPPRQKRVSSSIAHPSTLPGKVAIFMRGRIKYVDRPGYISPPPEPVKKSRAVKVDRPPAPKFDPKYLMAARELRDRWLEQVGTGRYVLPSNAKYDVSRRIELAAPVGPHRDLRLTVWEAA
jgi:N-acetylglutamate synthase-like GNAT family acetyltransferase